MDIGKVIGTVVATRKEPLVAVDTLQDAGVGEIVHMGTSGDAVGVNARQADVG